MDAKILEIGSIGDRHLSDLDVEWKPFSSKDIDDLARQSASINFQPRMSAKCSVLRHAWVTV